MGIVSVDDRYNSYMKEYEAEINAKKTANKTLADNKANVIKEDYGAQIGESGRYYDALEQQNAVQKLINEREIAENMASMGLTDSGLNRTQMTAAQLSAANNSQEIARQRQSVIDGLNREMNGKLVDIENARIESDASIDSTYEGMAMDAAVKAYNADVSAAKADADSRKIDYSAINTVTSDILSKENFEKYKQTVLPDSGVLLSQPTYCYTVNGKSYNSYEDYVESRLREHYEVFGTINYGTLIYLMENTYRGVFE